MKILIIEDEQSVASFIKKGLQEQSFGTDVAYDGESGKQMALKNDYDVILLDIIIPHINGLELCKQIKQQSSTPILMLSALGDTNDIVTGLNNGADDYLTKPFKFQELLARINALIRRKSDNTIDTPFRIADLEVDFRSRQVKRNNQIIKLTGREYFLLLYFIRNKGVLLSRADISENVWDSSIDSGSNVVDVYINYLRNKIDKEFSSKLIHTVYGMGYIFREEERVHS
jgi:two-component system copper resistance phosphate regulon response regulator CusR